MKNIHPDPGHLPILLIRHVKLMPRLVTCPVPEACVCFLVKKRGRRFRGSSGRLPVLHLRVGNQINRRSMGRRRCLRSRTSRVFHKFRGYGWRLVISSLIQFQRSNLRRDRGGSDVLLNDRRIWLLHASVDVHRGYFTRDRCIGERLRHLRTIVRRNESACRVLAPDLVPDIEPNRNLRLV
jgi:hypothetical protein